MPLPYTLIARPLGDHNDPFDNVAIEMSIAHNMFVRGLNAIYAQAEGIRADQVKAFTFFCIHFFGMLHHHHHIEETITFPRLEAKLGPHVMDVNVGQHHAFMDGLTDVEVYLKELQAGTATYNGALLIGKLNGFCDTLVEQLHEEIPTLESSRIRAAFTKEYLEETEAILKSHILKDLSLVTTIPTGLVCHDKSSAAHFPPLPKPVLWLVQYCLFRVHSDAWAFGPCDAYGKVKPGFGNDLPVAA
ncbi:hypothetical protein B0H10DRAFT_760354 [Mycena sp. CBHHK59/15]|nr:hypothetical protein B0H10DRAFT_760354 [Mycena sp. CBHHK59/15]